MSYFFGVALFRVVKNIPRQKL